MRIAVCDDSPDFLQRAVDMVERWSEQSGIQTEIYRFDNGDALLTKNAVTHMDIIFLDIIMPLLNGMDTARELRTVNNDIRIVFLTSSPEFALESYSVKANGYILKPVTYQSIKDALDECLKAKNIEPKSVIIKTPFGFQKVYISDIEYIEAQNKRVIFYLRTGKTVEAAESLHSLEERLSINDGFFKCHRSYLVYIPNVDHFSMTEITTKTGRSIPIARGCGKAFKDAYFTVVFKD